MRQHVHMDRLRVSEAARILGIHPRTLRRWLVAGRVPHVRLPTGERRIERSHIDDLLDHVGTRPPHTQ